MFKVTVQKFQFGGHFIYANLIYKVRFRVGTGIVEFSTLELC